MQPLALMACEKFGATLAMCPETNKKMEDLIIKVSGPKYVRFMSAQIGYSAKDSATQLSRSLAGIQLLGLAAALIASVDMFEGANALSAMLMASASDKTLLPTARQLKDLLVVMEHRVNRSGFTDIWVGYQLLLFGGLGASHKQSYSEAHEKRKVGLADLSHAPTIDGISKLVDAFRQLDRLGDAIAITIRTTSCAPWVMAFTRWCLGVPPSTILPDGKALLDQPNSRMTLFTHHDVKASGFEISVHRSIGSPADLLKIEGTERLAAPSRPGMITMECFGQMRCQEMGGEGSFAYRAMCEALPYALKQSCKLLQPITRAKDLFNVGVVGAEQRGPETEALARLASEHRGQPFPNDVIISSILTRVLNSQSQQNLQCLDDGRLISDLPLVHLHLRGCVCKKCRNQPLSITYNEWCEKDTFFYHISRYATDILALSIFESPEMLLVSLPNGHDDASFLKAVYNVIRSGKPAVCAIGKILGRALTLVGHTDFDENGWVISCYRGQTVYPSIFETRDICQPGYLMLCWAPGLLFFDGEVYNKGIDTSHHYSKEYRHTTDSVSIKSSRPVLEPLNLVPNMRMEWKVVRCDGYLGVYLMCGGSIGQPSRILMNLSRALILRGCPHDSASPLDRPDPFSNYLGPSLLSQGLHNNPRAPTSSGAERRIDVVAVDGDASLRIFAVSVLDDTRPESPFVIRKGACLQCCLDLCRRAGSDYLIC